MPTTLIGKLLQLVVNIFHKAAPVVDVILTEANKFVDAVKNLEASDAGQFLESGIEAFFPQFAPIIQGFKLEFPKLAALIANLPDEVATEEAKIEAFLHYLAVLKANNVTLYASALNALSAASQQYFSANQGVVGFTPQMSIAASQVVHSDTLGLDT